MTKTVDVRGLSCPQPVIDTKKVLDGVGVGEVVVLLDEEVAQENVSRLAVSYGYKVAVKEESGEYSLTLRKEG